jgi:hypothetical protein
MVDFLHVSPIDFLHDSFRLGKAVYESGFRPKHVISIWRGGTPVGLGIDAYFRTRGLFPNHTTIATESYSGVAEHGEVTIKGLEHLIEVVCPEDGLLIVDDVLDSGRTIKRIVQVLREGARANAPEEIRVATVHRKPDNNEFDGAPVICLEDLPRETWIVYPHELADLVRPDDPEESAIRRKDEEIWRLLHGEEVALPPFDFDGEDIVVSPRQLLLDSIRLGIQLVEDESFRPDYLVALWPGGVQAGMPVHEVYKYFEKKGRIGKAPDHISLNTVRTRTSYRTDIIGIHYLVERIGKDDNVLIIDTTFHSGRIVNDALMRLKEALRRNLSLDRVRVAAVYHNPSDRSTWTVPRVVARPHYILREVKEEVVYPQSVFKLRAPQASLAKRDPVLHEILFGG